MNNYFIALNNCKYIKQLLDIIVENVDPNYLSTYNIDKQKVSSLMHILIKNLTIYMFSIDKNIKHVDVDFLIENSNIWSNEQISKDEATNLLGISLTDFSYNGSEFERNFYKMYGIKDGYIGVSWAVILKLVENSKSFLLSIKALLAICALVKHYLCNLSSIDNNISLEEDIFISEYTSSLNDMIYHKYKDIIKGKQIDEIINRITKLYRNIYYKKINIKVLENYIFQDILYSSEIVDLKCTSSNHITKPLSKEALEHIKIDNQLDNTNNNKDYSLNLKDVVNYKDLNKNEEVKPITSKDIPKNEEPKAVPLENSPTDNIDEEEIPEIKETLEELIANVDELIGLELVKKDLKDIINLVQIRNLRKEKGLPVSEMSFHLVFTGNPGTGKTTIARLLSKIYAKLNVVSKGQLVEVDRSQLIAGYVGQTAIKVKEQIDNALGGVLFIDEAYTLTVGDNNDFAQEAVATLLKGMEDNRDDLVVIVAGYTDLMGDFIESNPGLKSRFNKYIHFPDYSLEEMLDIFKLQCKKNQFTLDKKAEKTVMENIKKKLEEDKDSFANARGVRNYFEKVLVNQANRLVKLNKEEITNEVLQKFTIEDVNC